jgi:glutaminyl-tRNA synthetase
MTEPTFKPTNFIRQIIEKDLNSKTVETVVTRFPPEPNGYLHIGHAKSMCLNFGLAEDFNGRCQLRLDDTNPSKESDEYAQAIIEDVKWLGFEWHGDVCHASDYYQQLYNWAIELINKGLAYVDSQDSDTMRKNRGNLTSPGIESPFRVRNIAENLDLLERMRRGEFADGEHVLRAKIDMQSPNMNMRDPVIYRIMNVPHERTGDTWHIYPLYDFAHGLSDSIEGVTHSICTLEFEDHRPLYNWFINNVTTTATPHQYEFSRANLDYTMMSKRLLNLLVTDNYVNGWDDPRMPTLAGMRRLGYPPEAIKEFCNRIGVTKQHNQIELSVLEGAVRDTMDSKAVRAFAITEPLKVTITNYDGVEFFQAKRHPKLDMGQREIGFGNTIWIEKSDFAETPQEGFKRLSPGAEVKLRYSYIMRCDEVIKDRDGNIIELKASIDPDRSRKFKGLGIIHWLSAGHAVKATFRLYDRLFKSPTPKADTFAEDLNPLSLVETAGYIEAGTENLLAPDPIQFERMGYFVADSKDHTASQPVFNRTVSLKDNWQKS